MMTDIPVGRVAGPHMPRGAGFGGLGLMETRSEFSGVDQRPVERVRQMARCHWEDRLF